MDDEMVKPNFDYIKSWLKVYEGKRRYFLFRTCMIHNMFAETAHDLDSMLEEFLRSTLGDAGEKNPNFMIRLYSDHGDH